MKKPIIIGSIVLGLLIISGVLFIFRSKWMPTKHQSDVLPTTTEIKKEMVKWEDPAGFSFQYPKEILVNKHDEDVENYAHVEFTSATHPGTIIVWAKDTVYETVASWIKNDKTVASGTFIDTTLGGKEAKKIVLTGTTKKLIIGAIDDDILFTIEAEPIDESFWNEVYQGMIQTFTFSPLEETTTESSAATDEDASSYDYDEEEVLE